MLTPKLISFAAPNGLEEATSCPWGVNAFRAAGRAR